MASRGFIYDKKERAITLNSKAQLTAATACEYS